MKQNHQEIGIGIIGSGRMGNLRSSVSRAYGSVKYIGVSDKEINKFDNKCQIIKICESPFGRLQERKLELY